MPFFLWAAAVEIGGGLSLLLPLQGTLGSSPPLACGAMDLATWKLRGHSTTSGDKRAASPIVARNFLRRMVFCAVLSTVQRPENSDEVHGAARSEKTNGTAMNSPGILCGPPRAGDEMALPPGRTARAVRRLRMRALDALEQDVAV